MLNLNLPALALSDLVSVGNDTTISPVGAMTSGGTPQDDDLSGPQALSISSSAPYYMKAIDSGQVWSNNGTGVTINYKFWTSLPSYYSSSSQEAKNFQPFTSAQKGAVLKILDLLSSIANVTFNEVTSDSSAQMGFAQANLGSGIGAWAYYPGTSGKSGDVWANNLYSTMQSVGEGTYGFMALAHEIGHALGLSHPSGLPSSEDNSRFTIMSYKWPLYPESYMLYDIAALQAKYGANMNFATGNDNYALKSGAAYTIWDAGGSDTLDGSVQSSALTLNLNAGKFSSVGKTDNIAIAYNVTIENAKGGSGADILYGNTAANHIWGNGGNDKIYASAGTDILDGGTGTDTAVYTNNISDFLVKLVDSVTVTLTNALTGFDTLMNIEKFIFGSLTYDFSDLLTYTSGNTGGGGDTGGGDTGTDQTDATLTGTSSSETLTGGAGNDVIYGNGGYDKIYGGSGHDIIHGGASSDKIYGEDGSDTLYGNGSYDYLYGGNGDDTLHGGDYTDKLYGDAGNDTLFGEESNDYLYGGSGDDDLDGGNGSDRLYGEAGNDTLSGGAGNDTLYGSDGNDTLIGGDGTDYLYGDNGNDVLIAGLGRDTLYGKSGSDTFAFDALDGNADYFKDFTLTGSEADKLNITDILTGFDGSDDINDFVQLDTVSTSQTKLLINQDGAGSDWVTAAVITGSNFSNATVDSLLASGQLITNETLL